MILTDQIKKQIQNFVRMIEDWYVSTFAKCRRCGKKIDSSYGYWKWVKNPALKHGYYHPKCGTLNNQGARGFLPSEV